VLLPRILAKQPHSSKTNFWKTITNHQSTALNGG
jgi:hypothetical protein